MDDVALRDHITAILDEQRRGIVVAEQEREKAARALREEMSRAITEGDTNLREHIGQQVQQIRAALLAADELEKTRFEAVRAEVARVESSAEQHVAQLRRERELVTRAQMEAISKAEEATEKRFESVNEFRQTLTDQTAEFIRREVFDARVKELQTQITQLRDQGQRTQGRSLGVNATLAAIATVMTLVLGSIVVVVNILV